MTKDQIGAVLDRIQSWPQARQEDAVSLLLAMEAQESSIYRLNAEERGDLELALREAAEGELATDAEVAALFRRT